MPVMKGGYAAWGGGGGGKPSTGATRSGATAGGAMSGGAAGPAGGGFVYPAGTRMPNGAISDGKGGTMGAGGASSSSSAAPALSLHADTNQALEALGTRYNQHLTNMEDGSGKIFDIAGQRIRDAREGGRKALQESGTLSGRASDPAVGQYDAETAGLQAGAIADTAAQREANLTAGLQGGVNVLGAPADLALREKGLQVNAYQAQNAANSQSFQQFLALLDRNRSSPIYMG